MPEPPACTAPTATTTPAGRQSAGGAATSYTKAAQAALGQLSKELADFRDAYPDRTFYRTSVFRTDFVNYAGEAHCTIAALEALKPAGNAPQRTRDFDAAVKAILVDYDAALTKGRDAISQRNTSKYRDWWDSMDELEARVAETLKTLQN